MHGYLIPHGCLLPHLARLSWDLLVAVHLIREVDKAGQLALWPAPDVQPLAQALEGVRPDAEVLGSIIAAQVEDLK